MWEPVPPGKLSPSTASQAPAPLSPPTHPGLVLRTMCLPTTWLPERGVEDSSCPVQTQLSKDNFLNSLGVGSAQLIRRFGTNDWLPKGIVPPLLNLNALV